MEKKYGLNGNCKKYWDKLTENLRGCISRRTCEIQQLTIHFKKKRVEKRLIIELCYVVLRNLQVAHKSMPS